jgi:hypothetical protein
MSPRGILGILKRRKISWPCHSNQKWSSLQPTHCILLSHISTKTVTKEGKQCHKMLRKMILERQCKWWAASCHSHFSLCGPERRSGYFGERNLLTNCITNLCSKVVNLLQETYYKISGSHSGATEDSSLQDVMLWHRACSPWSFSESWCLYTQGLSFGLLDREDEAS